MITRNWRTAVDRLCFKYGSRAADAIVSLLTLSARVRLSRRQPISVLIDNTVLAHAVTHETAWISTGKELWGREEVETGYGARIPVRHMDGSREYRNVSYLAGVAHLARVGHLSLMTSGELDIERLRQPAGRFSGFGYFDHNLFAGVEMTMIDAMPDISFGPRCMSLPDLGEQQRNRLAASNDPLYLDLLRQLGPNNSQDAWHIRTAEAHGLFCFLTMDFALLKSVAARRSQEPFCSLRTKIMTPEQLGAYLRLRPVNPQLLTYKDASFFVRPNLRWLNGKRQRPARTRSD